MESQDELGSLFEGMVLIDPFQISSSDDLPPTAAPAPAATTVDREDDDHPAQSQQSHLQPLDENLFSDLSLVHDPATSLSNSLAPPPAPPTPPDADPPSTVSRQVSRKKKRGLRIGYGREVAPASSSLQRLPPSQSRPSPPQSQFRDDSNHLSDDSPKLPPLGIPDDSCSQQPDASHPPNHPPPDLHPDSSHTSYPSKQQPSMDVHLDSSDTSHHSNPLLLEPQSDSPSSPHGILPPGRIDLPDAPAQRVQDDPPQLAIDDVTRRPQEEAKDDRLQENKLVEPLGMEHGGISVEEELQLIKTRITKKLHQIREIAASVSGQRKEFARKRRKAADKVNLASATYKQLEKELDESCEAEDFEKAEKVSEKLATAEKEKEELLNELRETEADCDSIDSKLQEVLEMQIAAEEEAASLLKEFAKVGRIFSSRIQVTVACIQITLTGTSCLGGSLD